jgi:hypothetical protein
MHGAALAEKGGAERREDAVDLEQDSPEALRVFRVVGRMLRVLVERNRVYDLVRHAIDAHRKSQRIEHRHHFGVKVGHRARSKRQTPLASVAHAEHHRVVDEIEGYVEHALAVGN